MAGTAVGDGMQVGDGLAGTGDGVGAGAAADGASASVSVGDGAGDSVGDHGPRSGLGPRTGTTHGSTPPILNLRMCWIPTRPNGGSADESNLND